MIVIIAVKHCNNVFTIMTKPAYALSLAYNSGQNYKLFKVFEQQRIKYDDNHLAGDNYLKKSANSSEPGRSDTQDTRYQAQS